MLDRMSMLHGEGYSVVMIDLQAHRESFGTQIKSGIFESTTHGR